MDLPSMHPITYTLKHFLMHIKGASRRRVAAAARRLPGGPRPAWFVARAGGSAAPAPGFLHFTPTGAHPVLPRWSPAATSRNLAP